jgi:hypothetical protein
LRKKIGKNKFSDRGKLSVVFDRAMSSVYENNIFPTLPYDMVEIHNTTSQKAVLHTDLPSFFKALCQIFAATKFMKQTSFTSQIVFPVFLFDIQSNFVRTKFLERKNQGF